MTFVDIGDGCWIWLGGKENAGYGIFSIGHETFRAHRISYEIFNGEIPQGFFVCHSCDLPSCVNPVHLWIGTQHDNLIDARDKGRIFKKLNPNDVKEIRESCAENVSRKTIASKFGVSEMTISDIHLRKKWANIL